VKESAGLGERVRRKAKAAADSGTQTCSEGRGGKAKATDNDPSSADWLATHEWGEG
jgi:hypothetical protein